MGFVRLADCRRESFYVSCEPALKVDDDVPINWSLYYASGDETDNLSVLAERCHTNLPQCALNGLPKRWYMKVDEFVATTSWEVDDPDVQEFACETWAAFRYNGRARFEAPLVELLRGPVDTSVEMADLLGYEVLLRCCTERAKVGLEKIAKRCVPYPPWPALSMPPFLVWIRFSGEVRGGC
jgi:hypothetical protein